MVVDGEARGDEALDPTSRHILFIGHNATRSGAPLLLLRLIRWLRANTEWRLTIAVLSGGELMREYARVGTVINLGARPWGAIARRRETLRPFGLPMLGDVISRRRLRVATGGAVPDLVYANTVVGASALDTLGQLEVPTVCHVHELGSSIRFGVPASKIEHLFDRPARIVACSNAVGSNLIRSNGVDPSKISVIHGFTEAVDVSALSAPSEELRRKLGIRKEARIVGGVGSAYWWKGIDLFLQVAGEVSRDRNGADVHFVWIGAGESFESVHDVRSLGLSGRVHFLGPQENPLPAMSLMDVFLLTSREDSFPLACLEAGSLGIPVICFENAGGAPEYVESDAGYVVPYLSTSRMARHVCELIADPVRRELLGSAGRSKVRSRFATGVCAPQIKTLLSEVMSRDGRSRGT